MGESLVSYNIHEAKTHLSRIIEQVERGEVVISRAGTPVAELVPLPRTVRRSGRGSLHGQLVLADDWDAPDVDAAVAKDFGIDRAAEETADEGR